MCVYEGSSIELCHEKTCFAYANNKGADQPSHPRSLISTFVGHCLDRIMPPVSISEISSLYLASVAAQAGLCLNWSQIPKTGFLMSGSILRCYVPFSSEMVQ